MFKSVKMKLLKIAKINLILIVCTLAYIQSCKKCPCDAIVCLNGGDCVDGDCKCPPGFTGDRCEIVLSIQQRLNLGEDPLSLVKGGILLDSLYGKLYAGGMIFFIDMNDSIPDIQGMVAAVEDQASGSSEWGCSGLDILNLNNVADMGFTHGAELGDGQINSELILAECFNSNSAAKLCNEYKGGGYDDWFLPSRYELYLMHMNLYKNNYGGFFAYYWSSTEANENSSWEIYFPQGEISLAIKDLGLSVRAARAF